MKSIQDKQQVLTARFLFFPSLLSSMLPDCLVQTGFRQSNLFLFLSKKKKSRIS